MNSFKFLKFTNTVLFMNLFHFLIKCWRVSPFEKTKENQLLQLCLCCWPLIHTALQHVAADWFFFVYCDCPVTYIVFVFSLAIYLFENFKVNNNQEWHFIVFFLRMNYFLLSLMANNIENDYEELKWLKNYRL